MPDIRGFGESGKPANVADYTVLHCAGDVVALLHALGERQGQRWSGTIWAHGWRRQRSGCGPTRSLRWRWSVPWSPARGAATLCWLGGDRGADRRALSITTTSSSPGWRTPSSTGIRRSACAASTMRFPERRARRACWFGIILPGETALDTLPDPGHAPAWLGECRSNMSRHYRASGFLLPLAHHTLPRPELGSDRSLVSHAITQPMISWAERLIRR
ncbi:MAG: hypothetical protein IPM87_04440 [Novosphingobium sp.]|nr:hypothetical protein [Novosphingobium sp.]MBK9010010.1 hypothetical protein [Novosphingobium sp.]